MRRIYDIALTIIILLKIAFIISTLRLFFYRRGHPDGFELERLEKRNRRILEISEAGMFGLLLFLFRPGRGNEVIHIGRHEQLIFFVLGIVGLMHLNWHLIVLGHS